MHQKFLSLAGFAVALFLGGLLIAPRASAAVRCEIQYGVGEVCIETGELQIDKEVWNPDTQQFVDNLGLTSRRFGPGEEVIFKLKITNVGDAVLKNVRVTDNLPAFLTAVSGDLSFTIPELAKGATEERVLRTRVVSENQLPQDTILCKENVAEAVSEDGERDKDTSQVCVERKVKAAVELPEAGSQDALILLTSVSSLLAGLFLVRRARSFIFG